MKKIFYLICCLQLVLSFSCRRSEWVNPRETKTYGYVPVYANKKDINNVTLNAAKPTTVAGKIYAYGNYIFQNDVGTGVHIIDNTNKQNPVKTGFLNIPYNYEIAIKDSFLYANSFTDLLVIDIRNTSNPKIINRVNGVFPALDIKNYPNEQDVYFECADTTKGVVVGWKKQAGINKNCYR